MRLLSSWHTWLFMMTPMVWAQPDSGDKPDSADVHALMNLIHADVERIRFEMGGPLYEPWPLVIREADPREVYFLARTLFLKADRLCFEQTREQGISPGLRSGEIRPGHVYQVIQAAQERIEHVKAGLGILVKNPAGVPDPSKTPSDVFLSILHANRQINLLLEKSFSPSEVYREVTRSVNYTARILALFPDVKRIPEAPAFQGGKQPKDVFAQLLTCFQVVNRIAEQNNIHLLHIEVDELYYPRITPGDVYDLATLLLAEIVHIHSLAVDVGPPKAAFYPGRKFPSQVFQRAGLLERQLQTLLVISNDHPSWLRKAH